MKSYLLIDSQGGFAAAAAGQFFVLACDLARRGHKVELLLVQNAASAARRGAKAEGLDAVLGAGIAVWADERSMKERAIEARDLVRGVETASVGVVIDRMAEGWNILWH